MLRPLPPSLPLFPLSSSFPTVGDLLTDFSAGVCWSKQGRKEREAPQDLGEAACSLQARGQQSD